ncbi:MAG: zf-HC2 domain-containing protein [Actinomycetota bacterium]|nr:zf-HC2 domain-containing protein [Actinomycetota bacterium]
MNRRFELDPCAACEELLQSFLDRALTESERREAQRHLDLCRYCAKRYRFEESLRGFVRQSAVEEMPLELKQRLQSLRTPLV